MARQSPQFEVRCEQCDVSFAAETRKCIHCGRATTAPGNPSARLQAPEYFETEADAYGDFHDSESEMAPSSPFGRDVEPGADFGPVRPPELGEVESESGPVGAGRMLLRSMGSLIWIALIIGFSIFRNGCGE